ncbi:MAG: hypothetical protein Q9208_000490 [Pyrenodesmia sp. 3 TL-2023]
MFTDGGPLPDAPAPCGLGTSPTPRGLFGENVPAATSPPPFGSRGLFGAAPTSIESGPSQSASASSEFETPSFTAGAFGSGKQMPTVDGLFESFFPGASETAATSTATTSTAPGNNAQEAGSAPTATGNGASDHEWRSVSGSQSDDETRSTYDVQSDDCDDET